MKRAFIVVGPESSGTRVLTRLLIALGCWGDGGHYQPLDRQIRERKVSLVKSGDKDIVFRRSIPHSGKYPDIVDIANVFLRAGALPILIVTTRNWPCMALSQVKNRHARSVEEAYGKIRKAEKIIAEDIERGGLSYLKVHYDFLVMHPRAAIKALTHFLGVESPAKTEQIISANNKHIAPILGGKGLTRA